ncbi:TraB/GumN family protein [Alkalihalophilus marmarensis]|uniref:TraB family protein n=1 Tax=Alkalihalophilus marmarensis DSM 21297 TaxID=1188261 RepID=U6SUX2_9BACI|nr:TraB/GumN family protein [Alkalihalophilus marmarensis]ERN54446.1 hypothetical protein A33I_08475 [Alkalihalophilus marmarensis DSM 21297]MCM3488183.1 TraB/GumN family protein [Alkalihalophilus marmarensis]
MHRFFGILILIFLLHGCSSSESIINNADKQNTVAEVHNESKGVFYKIENNQNTIYLFGSIHTANRDLHPLKPEVEAAFTESDYVAVELDYKNIDLTKWNELNKEFGLLKSGTIDHYLSPKTREHFNEFLSTYQIRENDINQLQPWNLNHYIQATVAAEEGFSPDFGIEEYFLSRAPVEEKSILQLESYEDFFYVWGQLPIETQLLELEDTLKQPEKAIVELEQLMDAWIAGDISQLATFRQASELDGADPHDLKEFYIRFFEERDLKMANKIEELLNSKDNKVIFATVGVLHLVGEDSIVEVLRSRGYKVQNIFDTL